MSTSVGDMDSNQAAHDGEAGYVLAASVPGFPGCIGTRKETPADVQAWCGKVEAICDRRSGSDFSRSVTTRAAAGAHHPGTQRRPRSVGTHGRRFR